MRLERFISRISLACRLLILLMLAAGFFGTPARAAKSYRFKVISITGMTELKTQSNSDAGQACNTGKDDEPACL